MPVETLRRAWRRCHRTPLAPIKGGEDLGYIMSVAPRIRWEVVTKKQMFADVRTLDIY